MHRTLLSLPDVVLRRILDFLLLVDEVEDIGPSKQTIFTKCHYETAVLRTCRTLYYEGLSVLRVSHFILVSTTDLKMPQRCITSNIPVWTKHLKHFKYSELRLYIVLGKIQQKQNVFFVLSAHHLSKFVDLLRLYTCMSVHEFRMKFEL